MFSSLCTSNNIKEFLFSYQAYLTIIRRNLHQFCVCIVCVAGGLMVVPFLKAFRKFFYKSCLFKIQLFCLLIPVPRLIRSLLFSFLNSGCPLFPHGQPSSRFLYFGVAVFWSSYLGDILGAIGDFRC